MGKSLVSCFFDSQCRLNPPNPTHAHLCMLTGGRILMPLFKVPAVTFQSMPSESVYLSVCPLAYLKNHILTKFSAHINCGRGSVLLDFTSGFVDDVMFQCLHTVERRRGEGLWLKWLTKQQHGFHTKSDVFDWFVWRAIVSTTVCWWRCGRSGCRGAWCKRWWAPWKATSTSSTIALAVVLSAARNRIRSSLWPTYRYFVRE